MIYLADTHILLRVLNRPDPHRPTIRAALRTLWADGHQLKAVPQNFIECWNASTRPTSRNGLGLTLQQADRFVRAIERLFPLLPNTAAIYPQWRQLVVQYGISGVQVHDAHLVAAMLVHNVTHILTFNTADFARYAPEGIVAVNPADV